MDTRVWKLNSRTWGEAAVDGLLAGVAAGLIMALFLAAASLVRGESVVAMLGQFDSGRAEQPVVGLVTHLAVAGVYGAIFSVIWRVEARLVLSLPTWAVGLLFGVGLWLVSLAVTAMGGPGAAGGWLSGIPRLEFAIAHGVYGLALGSFSARAHGRASA